METKSPAANPPAQGSSSSAETNVDRRRRKRAKMSAQLRVRALNSPTPFEEICKSVDVSRDGVFFLSSHSGYWKGQALEVTFPYSSAPSALNQGQPAEVVRVSDQGEGQFGIAVQFASAKASPGAGSTHRASAGAPVHPRPASVVVVIEPDSTASDAIRDVLQRDGYTAVVVPNAQAALDVLKTTVPSVFVTDVENSDIDGHDFCLIIRRNERLQHVPIILLTSSTQPADYATSQQLGAVVCIAKSPDPDRLLKVVRLVAPPPTKRSAYGAPVQSDAIDRNL